MVVKTMVPFLDPYYSKAPNALSTHKGTIILQPPIYKDPLTHLPSSHLVRPLTSDGAQGFWVWVTDFCREGPHAVNLGANSQVPEDGYFVYPLESPLDVYTGSFEGTPNP